MTALQHRVSRLLEPFRRLPPLREGRWSPLHSAGFHLRLLVQCAVRMSQERALAHASSLTYKTILSIVPTAAVALALLKAFGGFAGPEAPVVRFVSGLLMPPDQTDFLAGKIVELTSHISFGAIGGVSLTFLVVVAVSLLDTIDETFNVIWRVQRQRSMFFRFTTFYTLLTLGPLLLSVSLLQSARLQGLMPGAMLGKTISYYTPLLFTWIALLLSYKLFPNVRVHWKPAAIGALLAAVGIEALKFAFNLYLSESMSRSYTTIYGALALIPLFLVWIHLIWTIVLFGATYCYMLQNLPLLHERERARAMGKKTLQVPVAEHLACRVLTRVGRAFAAGEPLPSRADLLAALDVEEAALDVTVGRLLERGWLREMRECTEGAERDVLLPSRSLQQLRLPELVAELRAASREAGRGAPDDPLEQWLDRLDRAALATVPEATLAELTVQPKAGAAATAEEGRSPVQPSAAPTQAQ